MQNKNASGDSLEALMTSFPEEWHVGVFECCREINRNGGHGARRWVATATPSRGVGPPFAGLGETGRATCHPTPTEAVVALWRDLMGTDV